MYPQHMYPPGPEYAPGQSQMGMEASRSPARYPYMTYYGSKGPDPSAYGGMVGAGGMAPGHPYAGGGKPRGLSGQELMYGGNWNSMMQAPGYMGAPSMKVDMGGPYGMQPDMYGGGYVDSIPHPSSAMGGYPSSGYPAPPHQYPSSSQYAHYGSGGHSATGMPPPPPPPPPPHRSMMGSSGGGSGSHGPGTPGSVGGDIGSATPSQSMDGYQGGMSGGSIGGYGGSGGGSQTADAQWRSPAPASSGASASTAQGTPKRTWSGQEQRAASGGGGAPPPPTQSSGGGSSSPWTASGSFGSKPSTPGPQTPQAVPSPIQPPSQSAATPNQPPSGGGGGGGGGPGSQQPQPQQQQGSQQQQQQVFRQGSQSFGSSAMSPRTPYSNPEPLQKQGSISSLRDALISNTPSAQQQQQQQQQHYASYNSPRLASDHQPSPIAPHTPDAHTPVGAGSGGGNAVMSPALAGVVAHQDSLGAGNDPELMRTFSHQNSEMSSKSGGANDASQNNSSSRVSPFQVESILGIKNDKPIEPVSPMVGMQQSPAGALQHQGSYAESVNSLRDGSTGLQSPHGPPMYGPGMVNSQQDGAGQNTAAPSGGRPDSLGFYGRGGMETHSSPSLVEGKIGKTSSGSPVTRNHPSILDQYGYSSDQQRKEFLDSLFTFLEKEGIPLVRLPMICKVPFDLYKIYNSVRLLGGFITVMEKRLWREVLKAATGASNSNSGSLRTLQQYYTKLLLPYECHISNLDISQCLSKFENSSSLHSSLSSPSSQLSTDSDRMNHYPDMSAFDSNTMDPKPRLNGEAELDLNNDMASKDRLSRRLNSQDSGDSGTVNTQESSQLDTQLASALRQKSDDNHTLDIPEDSSNSFDSYSQGITEPLPDISVQDAESVLGMSPSPYPPNQPQPPGGPGTPSGGHSSSSPSHYPPGFHSGPPSTPNTGGQEMMDMGGRSTPGMSSTGGGSAVPPNYPPSYPMDPSLGGGYPSSMPPGYHPYNSPSPHPPYNIPTPPPNFQHPSSMMRMPYGNGSHYPGMPPSMAMHGHMPPMDYPHSGSYRSAVMSPHGPMGMRDMGAQPYPGPHGISPEWHWQHRLSSLPPHLQSSYSRQMAAQQSASAAAALRQQQHQQQLAVMQHHHQQQQQSHAQQQQRLQQSLRGSPGGGGHGMGMGMGPGGMDSAANIHMQDQQNFTRNREMMKMLSDRTSSASPRPNHHRPPEASGPESKQLQHHQQQQLSQQQSHHHHHHLQQQQQQHQSKAAEQAKAMRRPLPDWSNCVEGTKPHLVKRKRLRFMDCGQVEPWRLMMSLKSGLLAESTWALDTLNILLRDDTSVGYFYLKHHQSLLSTLVDHFKETLLEIFDLEFDNIPTYVEGHEGASPTAEEQGCKNGEKVSEKWLSKVTSSDFDVLSRASQQQNSRESSSNGKKGADENGNGESKEDEDMEDGGYSIPVVNVFDTSLLRLGKSDSRLHVQMPRADEGLFFPEMKERPKIMSKEERKELEESSRLQRIDQTPVALLLKREALLSQIPLHRFGRLSRSPRRRERSFYEEIRQRESLSRAEEDHSSTAGSSKGSVSEESKTRNECISPDMPDKVFAYNLSSSPKSAQLLTEECEIHQKEVLPLWNISPSRELLQGRCLCISNILRSLSFIPGNDYEFCQHPNILIILGRLLMLHHYHLVHKIKKPQSPAVVKSPPVSESNRGADVESPMEVEKGGDEKDDDVYVKPDEPHFEPASDFWWWDCLKMLQENTLIILSNIAGQLDLSVLPELVSYPIIDGLLHWAVCPSSLAIDHLSDGVMIGNVSPQRLVLETLAKMSITEVNVDFVLATPPLTRLDLLFSQLCEFIGQRKFPVVKQFALVLLSNLAQGNEVASRLIGQQKMVVSLLIECLEVAEHTSCYTGGALVGGYNPDDPNSLSIAMLRRAATTLHCLAKVPANRTAFLPYRDRMLYLATSQYVEPSISSILMDMLFEFGKL